MVTDVTKARRFSAHPAGRMSGVVEVTTLPVLALPKALCWKYVTASSKNFCFSDIDRAACAFAEKLRYCLQRPTP
ncbi:MAG: hypothetical protein JOZ00_25515 [Mycobacterium sp.]|uniref:hypothetical protein n=1 Tax=Mycobacterium sp. TaxID=1785 RepID=UPI001EB5AABD|nr:hypothetical protein [Mycobacterium sp.]MBV8790028.1 hypothetical protein [Mycobacterium sp.]